MLNCDISLNLLAKNIIETYHSQFLFLLFISYRTNNNINDNFDLNLINFNLAGGFIRTEESNNRQIKNIFVLDSKSDGSTIGLKLIDHSNQETKEKVKVKIALLFSL